MYAVETTLNIIPAKQRLWNSCVSACVGSAVGYLARHLNVGVACRDALEAKLGDNPVTFGQAAVVAKLIRPEFIFAPGFDPDLASVLEVAKQPEVVVLVGMNAAVLYGEPIERRHAMIVQSTTSFQDLHGRPVSGHAVDLIGLWSEQQSLLDPDPGKARPMRVSLAKAGPAFLGSYMVVQLGST